MDRKTIVFATDFSNWSDEALGYAETLASRDGARLLIVHVTEPTTVLGEGAFYYGVPTVDRGVLRESLEKVRPHDPSISCEHRLIEGNPAEALVELAAQEHADCIVLGSHGRTGLPRVLMGSVAEHVVRLAHSPVMVVKKSAAQTVGA